MKLYPQVQVFIKCISVKLNVLRQFSPFMLKKITQWPALSIDASFIPEVSTNCEEHHQLGM